MSGPKPDCYKCKYRAELRGSAHSQCTHPKAQPAKDDALGSVLAILGGARGFPGLTEKSLDAAISLGIKLNLHGLRNGWANWPHNFDPVWLDACEGFTSREV